MILVVSRGLKDVQKLGTGSFVEMGIWERQHIEEWVRSIPEMLGEDLLVASIEFDRFQNSRDRLDLLAIDRSGNLVVVELKRDSFAGHADLQAIRYAAMVSTMTLEKLLPYYEAYQRKYYPQTVVTLEGARRQIVEFVTTQDFEEFTDQPRIILCSEDFSQEATTTVLWLRRSKIDIRCVKITPYKLDEQVIIVPQVIIPLKEASQYLIDIQEKEETRARIPGQQRPTMRVIIENELLKPGDRIFLKKKLPVT